MKRASTKDKADFSHESLQDADSIPDLLDALARGIRSGKLTFSDEDGKIVLRPEGLLNVKLTASRDDGRNRVTLRIRWLEAEERKSKKRTLKVR